MLESSDDDEVKVTEIDQIMRTYNKDLTDRICSLNLYVDDVNEKIARLKAQQTLNNPRMDSKLTSQNFTCIIARKIMVYCKPFDDEVILNFLQIYDHI